MRNELGYGAGVWRYLPAQLNTVGELAILIAALPQNTPLRLASTVRVDPMVTVTGVGVPATVASLDAKNAALQLSMMVLADPTDPLPPATGYALNPLDRLREALACGTAGIGPATAAAAETAHRVAESLDSRQFGERVGHLAQRLRELADELVEETTLIELEQEL